MIPTIQYVPGRALKEILRLRKQDKDERDEQDSLLDLYLRAMESAELVASKSGVGPGYELLVAERILFSPPFNQPSIDSTIERAC